MPLVVTKPGRTIPPLREYMNMQNKRITILIAYAGFVALGLFGGAIGIAWPGMRDTFSLANNALGGLLLGGTAGYVFTSLANGALLKRFGVPNLLISGSILMSIGYALQSLAPSWAIIIMIAFMTGAGGGLMDAGLNTYAAIHFRPRLLNWLHASFGVGTVVGTLVLTAVITANSSWRVGLRFIAAFHALIFILLILTRKNWSTLQPASPDESKSTKQVTNQATLRLPIVQISIAVFFLYAGVEIGLGHWAYTLLTESRHIEAVTAGLWASFYWSSFTIGRILLGFIETNLTRLIRWSLSIVVLGMLLLWANPFPWANAAGLLIVGFATAPIFPALIALTPQRVGAQHASNSIGFQIGAAGLSAALIPGLAGVLAEYFTLEIIPPFMLLCSLLLMGLHERLVKKGD